MKVIWAIVEKKTGRYTLTGFRTCKAAEAFVKERNETHDTKLAVERTCYDS